MATCNTSQVSGAVQCRGEFSSTKQRPFNSTEGNRHSQAAYEATHAFCSVYQGGLHLGLYFYRNVCFNLGIATGEGESSTQLVSPI